MDDNKLLTLPSNERIRLLPHMKVRTLQLLACFGQNGMEQHQGRDSCPALPCPALPCS
jgi:hypothetical protein